MKYLKSIKYQEVIIIVLIILAAAIIRLIAAFNFGTYTFDDMFAVHFASMPIGQMFSFIKSETCPPFFYLLLHYWINIFHGQEVTNRLPSLIFNTAAIPLLYYLGKKIFNRWIATAAIIIYSLSYFQIFYSTNIRIYGLLTFLGLLSLNLFWLIFIERRKKLFWWYVAASTLMLFTHLGGIFIIATEWLWLLILAKQKQIDKTLLKNFFMTQGLIIGLWFFWFIPFLINKLPKIISSGWYLNREVNPGTVATSIYDYFFLQEKNIISRFISGVIIFCAPFMIIIWPDKNLSEKMPSKINPSWFIFAWLLPAVLCSSILNITLTRIFTISYLAWYLIVGYLLYLIYQNQKKSFWVLIAILIFISTANLTKNLNANVSRWDLAATWLEQNQKPGDKIIVPYYIHHLELQNYYHGNTPNQYFYPEKTDKSFDELIATQNWQVTVNSDNINQLKNYIEDSERILIIHTIYPDSLYFDGLFHQWFKNNGWQVAATYHPGAIFGPTIIAYSKP